MPRHRRPLTPPRSFPRRRSVLGEFGDYGDIFTSLFENAVELAKTEQDDSASLAGDGGYTLTIESYEAVVEQLPTTERVKQADGLLITGSGKQQHLLVFPLQKQ